MTLDSASKRKNKKRCEKSTLFSFSSLFSFISSLFFLSLWCLFFSSSLHCVTLFSFPLSFLLLLLLSFSPLRFDCGMGEGVVRSERPVVLNSWNKVTVFRDGWTAWLTLNDRSRVSGQSQGLFTQITFQLELFLGGSPNLTIVSDRTNSDTGFTGCVRSLEINERKYDFRADNRGDSLDGVDIGE